MMLPIESRSEAVRTIRNVSMGLIAISLSLPIWSALYLIPFVQPERNQIAEGQIHYMFSYENFVHEAGFGRLAISIIALLILLIPYRRGERWAFAALVILAVAYYVPVFLFGAIPNLGSWPLFRNWNLPEPKAANFALQYWSSLFLTTFLVVGLAMSAPLFFRKKA